MWQSRGIEVITFCAKSAPGQLALAPVGAALTPQLPQDGGQDNHEIAVGHQQITGGNIAVRNERFNCLSAAADQHGRLARLPKIVSRRLWLAIQQHAFGGQAEGIGFISRVIASERHLSKVSAPWLNGATSVALATLCRSGQSKCVASC
jgi:hypothetical protein